MRLVIICSISTPASLVVRLCGFLEGGGRRVENVVEEGKRRSALRNYGGGGGGKIQSEHIPNHPANNGNGKMREKVGTRRIRDEQHKSQNAETRTRWRCVQQASSANINNTNYDGAQTGAQYSRSINRDRSWEGSWDKETESGQLETSRAGWNSVWVL